MTSPALLLLAPLLGVTFGYEPSSDFDTGYDYTVQVEPELVDQLQRGNTDAIEVNIPPEVAPIRHIRIVVGSETLPKRLRPAAAVERTTYRQNIDATSPAIDLLAQTGPAGGFGRNSTGFNGGATQRPPAVAPTGNANTATVPAIGTQYRTPVNDIRGQMDASFEAAESGLANTRDAMRGTLNNIGAGGQRAIDNTRQAIGNMTAPFENLSDRAMQGLNNTTDAARKAFDNRRYLATEESNPTVREQPAPQWNGRDELAPLGTRERSVVSTPREPITPANTGLTQAERDYLDRIDRDRQRQRQLELQQAEIDRQNRIKQQESAFPRKPRQEVPRRNEQDVVVSLGDRSRLGNSAGHAGAGERSPMHSVPGIGTTQTNDPDWMLNRVANRENLLTNDTPATHAPPQIGQAPPAITPPATRNDTAPWLEGRRDNELNDSRDTPQNSSTPVWLLGWTIAVGSVVTNMFQWLNIVDMRNKYRVSLRRNSPNFARTMAA